MAPEMIGGEGVCTASDIYSLGVLMYEFAIGEHPYDANSPSGFLRAHLVDTPRPFDAENLHLPSEFGQLLTRMLRKDPAERPDARTCVKELSRIRHLHRAGNVD